MEYFLFDSIYFISYILFERFWNIDFLFRYDTFSPDFLILIELFNSKTMIIPSDFDEPLYILFTNLPQILRPQHNLFLLIQTSTQSRILFNDLSFEFGPGRYHIFYLIRQKVFGNQYQKHWIRKEYHKYQINTDRLIIISEYSIITDNVDDSTENTQYF